MRICTRSIARVPQHAHKSPKGVFILLEHFRRSRQDFRRGIAYSWHRGRSANRRPQLTVLPIVAPFGIKCEGDGALCEGEGVHLVGELHMCDYCRRLHALSVMDGYGSRYPNPKWDMSRPMGSYPHDLI